MSNHTPEPWKCEGYVVYFPDLIGGFSLQHCPDAEATARRIVACVNACQGLDTGDLEQHGLVSAVGYELIEMTGQRDELLSDMQDVLDMLTNQPHAVTAANQAEDMLRLSIGTAKYFAKSGYENHIPDTKKMVVPEGWQLVPVEPTPEMRMAGVAAQAEKLKRYALGGSLPPIDHGIPDAYRAMLSAAPKMEGGSA